MRGCGSRPTAILALLGVLVIAVAALVTVSRTEAASPRLYFYYQCATKSYCFSASTTTRHTSVEYFSMHSACKGGQSIDILNVPRSVRISRYTRRFTFKKDVVTFEDGVEVFGIVTVKGRVYPKKRLVGTWSVDTVATDCRYRKAGKFSMRFKFATGGGPVAVLRDAP